VTVKQKILHIIGEGELYGLQIIHRGRTVIGPTLHQGNVYPALAQMEASGVLLLRVEPGGPERGQRPRFWYKRAPHGNA
jgi:DNA-binding PadR family transcriptional regulator